jgi:hypothetical protein
MPCDGTPAEIKPSDDTSEIASSCALFTAANNLPIRVTANRPPFKIHGGLIPEKSPFWNAGLSRVFVQNIPK